MSSNWFNSKQVSCYTLMTLQHNKNSHKLSILLLCLKWKFYTTIKLSSGFGIWKIRACTIARLVTKFRGYWRVTSRTPPTKLACGGVQWLFLLEHHSFLSFTMRNTNYKLRLKRPQRNSRKSSTAKKYKQDLPKCFIFVSNCL